MGLCLGWVGGEGGPRRRESVGWTYQYVSYKRKESTFTHTPTHLDRRTAGLQELGVGAAEGVVGEAREVLHGGRFGGGGLLLELLAAADAEHPLGDVVGFAAGVEAEEVEEEAGVDGGGGDPEGGAGEAGHLVGLVGWAKDELTQDLAPCGGGLYIYAVDW